MFTELNLQPTTDCTNDSVSLYDGYSDKSPSIGKFCTIAPSTITSSESYLFVDFQTDDSVNEGRFSLNWTFVSIRGRGWFVTNIGWLDRHLTASRNSNLPAVIIGPAYVDDNISLVAKFWTNYNFVNSLHEEAVRASSLNSFKKNLVKLRKHNEDSSRVGQVINSGPTRPNLLPW